MTEIVKCGYVAIIGRPNTGKSTLLNAILGQKISITSRKAQTTRHRILGIKTENNCQAIYVDTPGLHKGGKSALNQALNKIAGSTIHDVDLVIFLIDAKKWNVEDDQVLSILSECKVPVVLAINKMDKIKDKQALLPLINELSSKRDFASVIPLSARNKDNIELIEKTVCDLLPESIAYYSDEQVTDRTERFLAAELIREKLMRMLGQEIPYSLAVEIEKFEVTDKITNISAIIWVERAGQKAIVIGKQGEMLKRIGTSAREDMEKLFDCRVYLKLWVKIKEGWTNDERALKSLVYKDEL
ncbi:MAG: GTPase Era [Gammaproteobacteria bacterium]|nr:GTPase Era [Gammaproteobacteria bacterium]MDH5593940.1 GTPase Era [Gammaproteobacteria bacterium]MDH5614904.1 GTPase Era [Gammaproteobacteria bacterium]